MKPQAAGSRQHRAENVLTHGVGLLPKAAESNPSTGFPCHEKETPAYGLAQRTRPRGIGLGAGVAIEARVGVVMA